MSASVDRCIISVVMATYQGASRIVPTLKTLENQSVKDFETIVVVDGSTDNTVQIINNANLSLKLSVIEQTNKGRASARNTGAFRAKAPIIVFFDDDVIVGADALERYQMLWNEGELACVGAIYPVYKEDNEFVQYNTYLNDKWNASVISQKYLSRPYLTAANCMIDKKVFDSVSGFHEGLRDAEDFDLAVRLFKKGIKIRMVPEIAVGHPVPSGFTQYVKRWKEYKAGLDVLKHTNPSVAEFNENQQPLPWFKKFIYGGVSNRFFVFLVEVGVWRFLPRKIRFKFYDLILTGFMY